MVDKYAYKIRWSEEDEVYICRCLEFPGLVAHGDSKERALKECKLGVKAAIKSLESENENIPEPINKR